MTGTRYESYLVALDALEEGRIETATDLLWDGRAALKRKPKRLLTALNLVDPHVMTQPEAVRDLILTIVKMRWLDPVSYPSTFASIYLGEDVITNIHRKLGDLIVATDYLVKVDLDITFPAPRYAFRGEPDLGYSLETPVQGRSLFSTMICRHLGGVGAQSTDIHPVLPFRACMTRPFQKFKKWVLDERRNYGAKNS
jgi:hypothetical protein